MVVIRIGMSEKQDIYSAGNLMDGREKDSTTLRLCILTLRCSCVSCWVPQLLFSYERF
jgi:hypothetical protein